MQELKFWRGRRWKRRTSARPSGPKESDSLRLFSFDNDDESGIIDAYGAEKMSYISQGCYDMNAGTQRVLRILVRHQMKGTFCMVGKTAEDVARWWLKNQDQR